MRGGNLLGRWQKSLDPASEIRLQGYVDYVDREEFLWNEERRTLDLDFQHRFAARRVHDIIWGLGYRVAKDELVINPVLGVIDPDSRSDQIFSGFLQDEIELLDDRLWLTLGTKLEHNDYSGFEVQPNIRGLWAPDHRQTVWASISRAVRTPSRGDHDARITQVVQPPGTPRNPAPLPVALSVRGSKAFDSEEVIACELGYRITPREDLSLDLAAYYNDYDNLRTTELEPIELGPGFISQPTVMDNLMEGSGYGLEVTLDWRPVPWWRLVAAYDYSRLDLSLKPESSLDEFDRITEGANPEHQLSLLTSFDLPRDWELDLWLRHVDELPLVGTGANPPPIGGVDAYLTLDLRLGWRPRPDLEIALVGKNLLEETHSEYLQEAFAVPAEVERSLFATLRWRF
jgi:iron complex outermembrane receptor protein